MEAIGFGPITAGTGTRITRGDGHRSITADGSVMKTAAGTGVPIEPGAPRGSAGGIQRRIAVGRPYRRAPASPRVMDGPITALA